MRKNYFLVLLAILFTVNGMAQNIPSYVPTNGLVGYWPFNGNANDESGNGNNGTVNGATLTTDRFGVTNNAYYFPGSVSNKIIIANSNLFNFKNEFTISTWAFFQEPWKYHTESIIYKGSAPLINGWHIGIDQNDGGYGSGNYRIGGELLGVGGVNYCCFPYKNINYWRNYILILEGDSLKTYIDGILRDIIPISNSSINNNYNIEIGGSVNPVSGAFNRSIDDIAIYNRALSQQEITALYTGCTNETATSSSFNSLLLTNGNAISVAAEPQGGVFTGTSIENNQFIPSKAKIGSNKVKYNFKNSQGCADSTVFNMVVADTVGKSCTKFDTVIVTNNVTKYDTVKVNKYDTITITNNVTKFDTIIVKTNVFDTVKVNKYDTITITNNVTKYDTVIVKTNVLDTVKVNKYDTITITNNITKYDTVIVTNNVTKYDTVKVNKYDTITITNNVTKYDTVIVKTNVFDTVKVNTYDTITITNNVTKYDTVIVNKTNYDTVGVLKIKFKLTTGINANQLSSLSIYPNPTSDVLHIEVSDVKALEGYRYRILDALGKEVYNELITQTTTEIPLKTLGAAGIYQFEILDATKTSIQSNKIVLY